MYLAFAVFAGLEAAFTEAELTIEYRHASVLIILVGFVHPILAVIKCSGSNSSSSTSLQCQADHDVMRNSLS